MFLDLFGVEDVFWHLRCVLMCFEDVFLVFQGF